MKERRFQTINCPNCGYSYLPAEIYLPNEFFGHPEDIERDPESGKIEYFFGKSLNNKETYICDKCNKAFVVYANINFITKLSTEEDFDEDHTTVYKRKSLFLDED